MFPCFDLKNKRIVVICAKACKWRLSIRIQTGSKVIVFPDMGTPKIIVKPEVHAHGTSPHACATASTAAAKVHQAAQMEKHGVSRIISAAYNPGFGVISKAAAAITGGTKVAAGIAQDALAHFRREFFIPLLRGQCLDFCDFRRNLRLFRLRHRVCNKIISRRWIARRAIMAARINHIIQGNLKSVRKRNCPPAYFRVIKRAASGGNSKQARVKHAFTRRAKNHQIFTLNLLFLKQARNGTAIAAFGHYCNAPSLVPVQVIDKVHLATGVKNKRANLLQSVRVRSFYYQRRSSQRQSSGFIAYKHIHLAGT